MNFLNAVPTHPEITSRWPMRRANQHLAHSRGQKYILSFTVYPPKKSKIAPYWKYAFTMAPANRRVAHANHQCPVHFPTSVRNRAPFAVGAAFPFFPRGTRPTFGRAVGAEGGGLASCAEVPFAVQVACGGRANAGLMFSQWCVWCVGPRLRQGGSVWGGREFQFLRAFNSVMWTAMSPGGGTQQ